MVQDLVHNLCESLMENIDGVAGIGKKTPTPIYLTQWKIVGNSEVHGQEIWSCGEYNSTDGKYHILVQPQGGSIADIALTEPLRKVNDVADTIEFPSGTEGKALVTRVLKLIKAPAAWSFSNGSKRYFHYISDIKRTPDDDTIANILCPIYQAATPRQTISHVDKTISIASTGGDDIVIYDADFVFEGDTGDTTAFSNFIKDHEIVYELKTATTELVDAPQIEEAESYTCVISQGGKAVSWSSFSTD